MKPEILADNSEVTINSQQVETLKKHFPQCFDKDGNFIAEKLNEIVADSGTALSKESYGLNWLGKSYARLLANENPLTLLAEDKTHNQKPENKDSQNLLIKGDNLEVLKHLKGAYSESIKMIYIDPPYNTGSDGFVYQDDRKFTPEQLAELAGIETEEAKRILEFTQSKANSHSAWLTFMYPRLYIARELLKDDGVIFISIDENEASQLKILCDEIFGESNFITTFSRVMKSGGAKAKFVTPNVEFIHVYAKNIERAKHFRTSISEDQIRNYYNKVETSGPRTGEKYGEERLFLSSLTPRPNQRYWIECPDGSFAIPPGKNFPMEVVESQKVLPTSEDGCWRWTYETYKEAFLEKRILFKETDTSPLLNEKRERSKYNIYFKLWLKDQQEKGKTPGNLITKWENRHSSAELKDLGIPFEFAKPSMLIKYLIEIARVSSNDMILDFFSGSATTAQAVMQFNFDESSNLKFILIQIPEPTSPQSEARKVGYKTIFDISKSRIKKAAEKIRAENRDYNGDLGFKIFETLPIFEGYLDNIETLQGDIQDLFDGATLSDEQLEHLLTTWKVYDGTPLTQPLVETDLAGYTAFRHDKVLYLMHQGFKTESLKEFLSKLDTTTGTDKDFDVEKIVLFGYNFNSKNQLEINEAVRQYQNRKEKNVSVVVRY
ncbi:type III restriction-modification system EcoP15I subunit M [Hydrogenovibrio marinus]|uniref:site-specific DNA-methyltransferase (adenine-specific) n=1 Tax=Hydrogenovibrio marinus TaxID=28885 RepID=A0A066ZVB6_HYDMR|nr:type III restriction-modification system EcoP15I subunit M [Hydrogenovibrio marinus]